MREQGIAATEANIVRAMIDAARSFQIDGLEVYRRDDQPGDVWEVRGDGDRPIYWAPREVAFHLVRARAGEQIASKLGVEIESRCARHTSWDRDLCGGCAREHVQAERDGTPCPHCAALPTPEEQAAEVERLIAEQEARAEVDGAAAAGQIRGMTCPPNPGRIAVLLAAARKLELITVTGSLPAGYFAGSTVFFERDGEHGLSWNVVDGGPPKGFASVAISVDTWTAMRTGDVDSTGVLHWGDKLFRVVALFDGQRYVATLEAVTTAA